MAKSAPRRKSLTESPWYWIYLFCTASLIALVLIGPKFAKRQALDERNFQARQRANQRALGQEPDVPLSTEDDRIINLGPLLAILAVVLVIAWVALWYTHFRAPRRPTSHSSREVPP